MGLLSSIKGTSNIAVRTSGLPWTQSSKAQGLITSCRELICYKALLLTLKLIFNVFKILKTHARQKIWKNLNSTSTLTCLKKTQNSLKSQEFLVSVWPKVFQINSIRATITQTKFTSRKLIQLKISQSVVLIKIWQIMRFYIIKNSQISYLILINK